MPLHVPGLAKKLQFLYQHHGRINSHELLAKSLGIAPNNISVWINGSDVRVPELVPNRHVKHLTELFEIPLDWLELASLDQFKDRLRTPAAAGSANWTRVLEQAVESDAIRLIRSGGVAAQRGLVADDRELTEQFNVGERLYIRLSVTEAWPERPAGASLSMVALCVDTARTSCLCPSALAPNCRLYTDSVSIPQGAPVKSLKVSDPVGLQSVLMLLTCQPLPGAVTVALMEGRTIDALDHLADALLAAPADHWRLLRKDYAVV